MAKLLVTMICGGLVLASAAWSRPSLFEGFNASTFAANDDDSIEVDFGFEVDFFGLQGGLMSSSAESVFLNNNGNLSFGEGVSDYEPEDFATSSMPAMLAAFWADIDTSEYGSPVKYGPGTVAGKAAWGATFENVGGYDLNGEVQPLNTFQLIVVDRSDLGTGDFDVYYVYREIEWDVGSTSTDAVGPVVGYLGPPSGEGGGPRIVAQLEGSTEIGRFIDGGDLSLSQTDFGNGPGTLALTVRNGEVDSIIPSDNALIRVVEELVDQTTGAIVSAESTSSAVRIARVFRISAQRPVRTRKKTAGSLENTALTLEAAVTGGRLAGGVDADSVEFSGSFSSSMGPVDFGLTLVGSEQSLSKATELDIVSTSLEGFGLYRLSDEWSLGLFASFTEYDVENATTMVGLTPVITPGDDFGVWGTGLNLGYGTTIGSFDVGVTAMLASLNKSSIGDVLDDEDSIVLGMLDVGKDISDSVRAQGYLIYTNFLDTSVPADGSYWSVVGEVSYAPQDNLIFAIGYETDLEQDDSDLHTVRASISWLF